MTEDNDPEADFWLHVGNAQNAIEDFNDFDPDGTEMGAAEDGLCLSLSFDPDGTETGRGKLFQITVDAIDLIEYVVENKDKLLEKMKDFSYSGFPKD